MVYDIIIGETLPTKYNYNYVKTIYFNRISIDEITNYKSLVDNIIVAIKESVAQATQSIDVVENVLSEFIMLQNSLSEENSPEVNSEVDVKIRELLSTLAYVGIDMYIIRRADLTSTDVGETTTRAYMIDKQDSLFPTLNRVVNGKSLVFDEIRDANISTVVMQFMNDVNFSNVVEDAIELDRYRARYEALEQSNMGWSLNTDRLIDFLDDYGYKFVVVV